LVVDPNAVLALSVALHGLEAIARQCREILQCVRRLDPVQPMGPYALQVCVVYTPFLQRAFATKSLRLGDGLRCTAVASSVLWLRAIQKAVTRLTRAQ
jgi:hypothetical protein